MRYRKLRIAWSAWWSIACVLLLVLWVRSYFRADLATVAWSSNRAIQLNSSIGHIQLHEFSYPQTVTSVWSSCKVADVDKELDNNPMMALFRQQLAMVRMQLEQDTKRGARNSRALERKEQNIKRGRLQSRALEQRIEEDRYERLQKNPCKPCAC